MPVVGSITLPVFGCYRCGHTWVTQGPTVKICPRCKSRLWNKPKLERRKVEGTGLGKEQVIGRHRDELISILRKHHAIDPRIFGSVARGEANSNSDLDLLVRFEEPSSLFDRIHLRFEIERLVERKVDVADEARLHWLAAPQILREAIPV
jgi:predicted nucleotidyltransferase